ncbi:MAG: hypothetical protein R6W82_10665 [bacterium]
MREDRTRHLPRSILLGALTFLLTAAPGGEGALAQNGGPGSPTGLSLEVQPPPRYMGDRWPLMFTWNRNKVNWWNLEWRAAQLPRSTLYYYHRAEPAARLAYRMARESDEVLQADYDYDLQTYTEDKRIPKIIYTSHHTFQQTHTIAQDIPEGLGGFTEFIKGRVVFPYTGSNRDFRHVLEHENAHAHMIHKLKHTFKAHNIHDTSKIMPTLWFSEGLAEFESAGRDPATGEHRLDRETEMYIRDAIIHEELPTTREMRLYAGYVRVYKFGHALLQYMGARWGADHVHGMLSNWHHLFPNRNSFNFLRKRDMETYDPLNPGVGYFDPPFVYVGGTEYEVVETDRGWRARTSSGLADSLGGESVSELVASAENIRLDEKWYRIVEADHRLGVYRPEEGVSTTIDGTSVEKVVRRQKEEYEKRAYRLLSFENLTEWWYGLEMKELSDQWHTDLRAHYTPWLEGRTRMEELVPVGEGATELWPTVSSDGRLALYKAYRGNFVYELMALDLETGHRLQLVTDNTAEVESLHLLSEGGDIRYLGGERYRAAFTAKKRSRDVVYLQDIRRRGDGTLVREGRLRIAFDPSPGDLVSISGVKFAGSEDRIVFSGLGLDGMQDIYLARLEESAPPERLTHDLASDQTPTWAEGRIYFASDRASSPDDFRYHLFVLDTSSGELTQLTDGVGSERNPAFSLDGRTLFFQSDASGASNIYCWSEDRGIRQVTDVATGVFAPAMVNPDTLLVSGFDQEEFKLFKVPVTLQEPRIGPSAADSVAIGVGLPAAAGPGWVERAWGADEVPTADAFADVEMPSRPYTPRFSLDDFWASSEFGGYRAYNAAVFGTEVRFSDLLGEHILGAAVWNGPREGLDDLSWVATYWNQKQRVKWGGSVYRTSGVYFNYARADFYLRERAGLNTHFNLPFSQFTDMDLVLGAATERRSLGTVDGTVSFREVEVGVAYTRDVSTWSPQGPRRGWVFSAFYDHIFNVSDGFSTFTRYLVGDVRGYLPLHRHAVLAGRAAGGYSTGTEPEFFFLGGGLFLRGYWDLYSLYGSSYVLGNTELRLQPLEIMGIPPLRMFEQSGWPLQLAFYAEAAETGWRGGRLGPLGSAGMSLRLTLALPFVVEYAWYRQRFWEDGPGGQGLLLTLLF